ncbi:hypothetical protein FN846DRAFT_937405 [Sphaerosporella brunnea]|uniref:Protein kinase domain-containing protein n=1 Tax=Sphaerosporella brunnea TaxID=1250544 RepID=A0A5J5F3N7_9PEZI|nr:hypothetical protein FN846DRAFT_937405 [Sphaerosporella brunnea]
MPSASVLAATNLVPPPARTNTSIQSFYANDDDLCEIYVNTTTPVPAAEIQTFRSYLATIPFDFHEHQYTMPGHILDSEGDVRLFLESAAVLSCWPVALSMVPATRQFDLHIRSEKSFDEGNRPAISVLYDLNGTRNFLPFLAIEFKSPGVLSFCRNGIPNYLCDDWVNVTTQLRRYACINGFNQAVVMDGCHALYFHFTDPDDEDATVRYMMASISGGPVGFNHVVTARELLLFAFFTALARISPTRDYIAVPVPAGSQPDYAEVYPPPAITPTPALSSSPPFRSTARQLLLRTSTQCFPRCVITTADITPSKGGDSVLSTRRPPKPFFLEQVVLREIIVEAITNRGRTMATSPPSDRFSTPPPTKDLMLKYFNSREVLMAYQEATAYAELKSLQGYRIPFCYGVYDVDGQDGVILLFEEIQGCTLLETLEKLSADNYDEFKKIYRECWECMQLIHECGYAHRDIKGDHIMMLGNGEAVFIGLKNTRPIDKTSRNLDAGALRLVFRQFGLQESLLREWSY